VTLDHIDHMCSLFVSTKSIFNGYLLIFLDDKEIDSDEACSHTAALECRAYGVP
jgi:hypothetical protein